MDFEVGRGKHAINTEMSCRFGVMLRDRYKESTRHKENQPCKLLASDD